MVNYFTSVNEIEALTWLHRTMSALRRHDIYSLSQVDADAAATAVVVMSAAAAEPDADYDDCRQRSEGGTRSDDQGPRRGKSVCSR